MTKELTPAQQVRVEAFGLTEPAWMGHDDMGNIQPGDKIETTWRGVTITGVADHVSQFGAWYTEGQGLLVPNVPQIRWRRL